MATILGYDESVYKKFTCRECGAIVQYKPNENLWTELKNEGTYIRGLRCPGCNVFHRTN